MTVEEFIRSQPRGTRLFEWIGRGRYQRVTLKDFLWRHHCYMDKEFVSYGKGEFDGAMGIEWAEEVPPMYEGESGYRRTGRLLCAIEPKAEKVAKVARETLRRVTEILDVDGTGIASCPHCGATGRYIYTFRCEDGTTRRAMAGCFARFPMAASVARRANELRKFA